MRSNSWTPPSAATNRNPPRPRARGRCRGVSLTFETADGKVEALSEVDLKIAAGEFVSLHRAVRLRQDHAAARHRRPRAAQRRHHRGQRGDPRRGAAQTALRLHLPGAGALSVAHDRAQRHAAARDHGLLRRASERRGRRAISRSSTSPASSASFPGSCPAACSSAPRSPARCRSIRRCC